MRCGVGIVAVAWPLDFVGWDHLCMVCKSWDWDLQN